MKRAGILIASLWLAQSAAAQLPPGPPPFGAPLPPGGIAGPGQPGPGPQAERPDPRLPGQPRPRGMRLSAIAYFDYTETTPMWTIDAPVTGFGNEALWEDMDPHFAPERIARASTARVASR